MTMAESPDRNTLESLLESTLSLEKPTLSANDDDMQFLLHHTTFEAEQINQYYYNFCQNFGPKGKVSKDQFLDYCKKSTFLISDAEEFCDNFFRAIDADKDGYIEFKEHLWTLYICTNKATKEEQMTWMFRLCDINDDERVSRDELVRVLKAVYS